VNDQRDRLLSRFRAVLLKRIENVRAALASAAQSSERRQEMLGELHTLKGEARMLGMERLAATVHLLEERAGQLEAARHEDREATREMLLGAVSTIHGALAVEAPALDAEQGLERVLAALTAAENYDAAADLRSEAGAAPVAASAAHRRWTQVETRLIDRLCEQVAELSASFSALRSRTTELADPELARTAARLALNDGFERCRAGLDACSATAWELRLVSIEPTLNELGRHAEALAGKLGKLVLVEVHARGVELESDVLDGLWEPLLHLCQNAIDHGIELPAERGAKSATAKLTINAQTQGPNVVLEVRDDGRGIDADLVKQAAFERGILSEQAARDISAEETRSLLFRHGFSTRSQVGTISGRGVGLDVVRSKVAAMGGSVRLDTEPGQGSCFTLTVPSAISKERLLVVESGGLLYGFPVRLVQAVVALPAASSAEPLRRLRHDGETIALHSLSRVLGAAAPGEQVAAILAFEDRRWALGVNKVVGEETLVRMPADPLLQRSSGFGASALLSDGRLVLLPQLDLLATLLRSGNLGPAKHAPSKHGAPRVLVADDSPVVRDLMQEVLSGAGFEVWTAEDGLQALRLVQGQEPDLVLTDVEMPNLDGLGLLERIRERTQTLPVVVLSTRGSVEDRRRAALLGANAYLVKSNFSGGALLDVVQRFLELPS
jgi:chemotaxis protein histidine kinase CheA